MFESTARATTQQMLTRVVDAKRWQVMASKHKWSYSGSNGKNMFFW